MATVIEIRASVAVGLTVFLLTADALADSAGAPQDSELLFRQGREAMQAGRYEAALSLFEASRRGEPALGTLLNVAVCEEKLGRLVHARSHLKEAHGAAAATDKRRALIEQRLAELDRRMPKLIVRGRAALGPDVQVTLDGRPLEAGALDEPIAVDPGEHLLACSGKRGETCAHTFRIAEGEQLVHELQAKRPMPIPSPERPPAPTTAMSLVASSPPRPDVVSGGWRRISAYTLAGVGVVGIAASLLAGAGAIGKMREQARHCDESGCDPLGLQAAASGDRLATIATWSAVVGLTAGAGSLVLFSGTFR